MEKATQQPCPPPMGGQIDCKDRHSAAGFDLTLSFQMAFFFVEKDDP